MPVTLPTEIKLQIVKHYIDLVVEGAIHQVASRYFRCINESRVPAQKCLRSIEALLNADPTITNDTLKFVCSAKVLDLKRHRRIEHFLQPHQGRADLCPICKEESPILERFSLRLQVLSHVLTMWEELEKRLGVETGMAERVQRSKQYAKLYE